MDTSSKCLELSGRSPWYTLLLCEGRKKRRIALVHCCSSINKYRVHYDGSSFFDSEDEEADNRDLLSLGGGDDIPILLTDEEARRSPALEMMANRGEKRITVQFSHEELQSTMDLLYGKCHFKGRLDDVISYFFLGETPRTYLTSPSNYEEECKTSSLYREHYRELAVTHLRDTGSHNYELYKLFGCSEDTSPEGRHITKYTFSDLMKALTLPGSLPIDELDKIDIAHLSYDNCFYLRLHHSELGLGDIRDELVLMLKCIISTKPSKSIAMAYYRWVVDWWPTRARFDKNRDLTVQSLKNWEDLNLSIMKAIDRLSEHIY